jgi:hypothetical protein
VKSYEVVLKRTIYYYKVIMIEAMDQRRIDGSGGMDNRSRCGKMKVLINYNIFIYIIIIVYIYI